MSWCQYLDFAKRLYYNAGAEGRWEGQNERGRGGVQAVKSWITPEGCWHDGEGELDGPDSTDNGFMMMKRMPMELDAWGQIPSP